MTLGESFPISEPVSPSSERKVPSNPNDPQFSMSVAHSLPISMKQTWISIYLIFLFIFGSLFLHLLEPPALPTLEASLFTLMCCEHDPGLVIKQSHLRAVRGGEYSFKASCLWWEASVAVVRKVTLHRHPLTSSAGLESGSSCFYGKH